MFCHCASLFKFTRRGALVNILRILWVIVVLWHESGIFSYSAHSCPWPDSALRNYTDQVQPSHLLVVADPQILDHRSYPGRPAILTYISQILVDLNLRKSWRAALRLHPNAVFFLGDMMDGGRMSMSDDEYERYYQRFNKVFKMKENLPTYFIPGNHDTGLGSFDEFSPAAHSRYTSHFGPLNSVVQIANHSIVLIDAPGLVEEDLKRHAHGQSYTEWKPSIGGTVEFIKHFAQEQKDGPTILLSHIPLSRPEGSECGPLREKGTIRRGVGWGYQNTLNKETTAFLLDSVKPLLILSGDDHDYCEYIHMFTAGGSTFQTREVTVKSLSMAMGIRRPGYQLLSLSPSGGSGANVADVPCIMPDQLGIYLSVYIPLVVLSLSVLLLHSALRSWTRQSWFPIRAGHAKNRSASMLPRQRSAPRLARTGGNTEGDFDDKMPLPVSSERPYYHRGLSWTFAIDGRHRRISCGCPLLCSRTGSVAGDFLQDVRDVAMYPVTVILLVSFWVFMDS